LYPADFCSSKRANFLFFKTGQRKVQFRTHLNWNTHCEIDASNRDWRALRTIDSSGERTPLMFILRLWNRVAVLAAATNPEGTAGAIDQVLTERSVDGDSFATL
jgi:hypothetical protein